MAPSRKSKDIRRFSGRSPPTLQPGPQHGDWQPNMIVACWSPHRHVELAVAMLDSRSPCWTPGCHVGLPVAMLGSWLQCRGRQAAKPPDIFAFPAWRHMVCLPLRRKLRLALLPLGCISGHGFLCSKYFSLGPLPTLRFLPKLPWTPCMLLAVSSRKEVTNLKDKAERRNFLNRRE